MEQLGSIPLWLPGGTAPASYKLSGAVMKLNARSGETHGVAQEVGLVV